MATIMRVGGGGGGSKVKTKPLSTAANGSTVSVLEDGKLTQFLISHNYEPELNGAGRTLFVRKGCYDLRAWNASGLDYAVSDIDRWLNNDYYNKLSPIVKANISITRFQYSIGGSRTVSTLSKAVFLLSITELGVTNSSGNVLGTELPIAGLLKVANLNGTATTQWTRTPYNSSNPYVFMGTTTGAFGGDEIYKTHGSRPCFTLPSDMALRPEPLEDGSWALADEEFLLDTETAKTAPKSGVTYTNGIADLDAATLHEIGKAISSNPSITNKTSVVYYDKGDVHRKISVGDQITITTIDANCVYDIIGFNHDTLSGGVAYEKPTVTGKAGFTLQMHDCWASKIAIHHTATNSVSWEGCYFRTAFNPQFENMPGFSDALKTVRKLTSAGNKSANIISTDDKVFLVSEIEVFGAAKHSVTGEGTQYAYYKAGNSKIKKVGSSASGWWTRSPYKGGSDAFCFVNTNGTEDAAAANSNYGIAIAICI